MGEDITEVRDRIINCLPKLKTDTNFKVTSPCNTIYNCIAWAYLRYDRWMWPNTGITRFLDGVDYWPTKERMSDDVSNFIKIFQDQGYQICDDHYYENGYRKIALYVKKGTTKCTHASRQKVDTRQGNWTSKLGDKYDIQHGDPYTIECESYGEVYAIMKKKLD